jgi:MoxR-like ATPase
LYLYLDYPSLERERSIVAERVPGITSELVDEVVRVVSLLRSLELQKHPSISETLDWARTLVLLGIEHVDADTTTAMLNLLLKYKSDIDLATKELSGTQSRH